jgi:hypothetical protein
MIIVIKIRVSKIMIGLTHYGLSFYFDGEDVRDVYLHISMHNDVQIRSHFWVMNDKDDLKDYFSLILILTKKALKVFKKDYPERYESVKENIERFKSQIL